MHESNGSHSMVNLLSNGQKVRSSVHHDEEKHTSKVQSGYDRIVLRVNSG